MPRSTEHFDVLVIGSGFGGSVTALRLSEKGYRVGVLEAGRRFAATDFAPTSWHVRRFLWLPRLGLRGIQRINLLKQMLVLSGAGVGGGSLVYANTLIRPHDVFFEDPQWRGITDWKAELGPFYDLAERMLGAVPAPDDTPADRVMESLARHFGVPNSYSPTRVGVFLGEPDVSCSDPYFGGAGPDRVGCNFCGGCMVGCRYNAKNTLDLNYLYLAEKLGARIFPEQEAVDIRPFGDGYLVTTRRPGSTLRRQQRAFSADQVVFAAGALGTTRLLLELQRRARVGSLPPRIGHLVRTNSEALMGAVARSAEADYSRGVAITSSIEPGGSTRIEPVRYPAGSNLMGLLGTIPVEGRGGILQPLRFLAQAIRRPRTFLRSLSVRHWSERAVILLVMQSEDNSVQLRLRRGGGLTSRPGHGIPAPRWLPVAHEAARAAAAAMGGDPAGSINESLAAIPMTAHVIGGATIGSGPETGVIDPYHRLYGHPRLHVMDGAAVSANLGANPSLTITALAERAASMWPNRGELDPRPGQGEVYRLVSPVAPRDPAVPAGSPAALR
jgi:cholesterol oxidase